MAGTGPMSQDCEPVVKRKISPNSAAKCDEKTAKAARRNGAESVRKFNAGTNKAASSGTSPNTKTLDDDTENLTLNAETNKAASSGTSPNTKRLDDDTGNLTLNAGTNKAASSGTSPNTKRVDDDTENLTRGNTKTLLVTGYTENATESEIMQAVGGSPSNVQHRSFTLAIFKNINAAAESLESLTKRGFLVEYAHENDTADDFTKSIYVRLSTISTHLIPLHIIWDWENCPIPSNYKVENLYSCITNFFEKKGFFVMGFVGFGNVNAFNDAKYAYLKKNTDIDLIHVPLSTDKDAADQAAKVELLQYVCDRLPPCHIHLLTGDKDFQRIISFVVKKGFHVYLGYNKEAVPELINSATDAWNYLDVFGVDDSAPKTKQRKRKNKKPSQTRVAKRNQRAQTFKEGQKK